MDMSVVNMYLMYLECWKKFPIGTRPMAHLQFRNNLCKAMIQGFHGRDGLGILDLPYEPRIHIPSWTKYRRECTLCGKRCHYFCFKCNCKFMCFSQGCFERRHTPRRCGIFFTSLLQNYVLGFYFSFFPFFSPSKHRMLQKYIIIHNSIF
jgi:hypothetical protein